MKIKLIFVVSLLLCGVSTLSAQRSSYQMFFDTNRMMNQRIMSDIVAKSICDDARRKGQKVPASCSKYSSSSSGSSTSGSASGSTTAKKGLVKFTPVSGDTSFQRFANDNGTTLEEKQLMLQIATNTKSLFETQYGAKGLKNNVAGAFAFFIVSNMTVYNGEEPSEVVQNALFEMLDQVLSQAPDFVNASNKDKQELYNTLIAYSGLPLTFYADAVQKGNSQGVKQARTLAAGCIKLFLKTDPESVNALLTVKPAA